MSPFIFGKARCLACFVGHERFHFFSGIEVTYPFLFQPHSGCSGSLPAIFNFFFFKGFLVLSPAHPMHRHWNTSYYYLHRNYFPLSIHCIFKKQMSELKKVDGIMFFFFLFLRILESLWKIAGSYSHLSVEWLVSCQRETVLMTSTLRSFPAVN